MCVCACVYVWGCSSQLQSPYSCMFGSKTSVFYFLYSCSCPVAVTSIISYVSSDSFDCRHHLVCLPVSLPGHGLRDFRLRFTCCSTFRWYNWSGEIWMLRMEQIGRSLVSKMRKNSIGQQVDTHSIFLSLSHFEMAVIWSAETKSGRRQLSECRVCIANKKQKELAKSGSNLNEKKNKWDSENEKKCLKFMRAKIVIPISWRNWVIDWIKNVLFFLRACACADS